MEYANGALRLVLQALHQLAWGPGTIGMLALCGAVFSFATGFFQLRGIRY